MGERGRERELCVSGRESCVYVCERENEKEREGERTETSTNGNQMISKQTKLKKFKQGVLS